ncbi:MAG TPA: hypothetical protein VMT85_08535 [Thermoanaerobaculia bacterium]|nr:hypothetical protein [Thermoanaerobaculia bacterium]
MLATHGWSAKFEFAEWRTFDAIHCRARAVFDPGMLRIAPMPVEELSAGKLCVGARIVAHSGSGLEAGELLVHWRNGDTGELATALVVADGADSVHRAVLPRPPAGSRLEYYVTAADLSGRRQSAPPVAPAASFSFVPGLSQP